MGRTRRGRLRRRRRQVHRPRRRPSRHRLRLPRHICRGRREDVLRVRSEPPPLHHARAGRRLDGRGGALHRGRELNARPFARGEAAQRIRRRMEPRQQGVLLPRGHERLAVFRARARRKRPGAALLRTSPQRAAPYRDIRRAKDVAQGSCAHRREGLPLQCALADRRRLCA